LLTESIATLGVIYLPAFGELYIAALGERATRNEAPVHVDAPVSLAQFIIRVGDFAKSGKAKDNTYRLTTLPTLANRA
jgi:fructose-1,6-bisphosphatase/inositol monophosphatase family enzyme